MATDPDNPFARKSMWPTMPQAPFRVGSLPNAGGIPLADTTPEPPPTPTITPLFVRPVGPARTGGDLGFGGAVPTPPRRPEPPPVSRVADPPAPPVEEEAVYDAVFPEEPAPAAVDIEPELLADAAPGAVIADEPEVLELAQVDAVTPAAALVGVAGVGALAAALTLTRETGAAYVPIAKAPTAAAAPPAETPVAQAAAAVDPASPVGSAAAAVTPPARPARAGSTAPVLELGPGASSVRVLAANPRISSDAAVATEEAINAPVLHLPAMPPPVAEPPPAAPAYRPPPPPDPNAPVRTQRPY